MSRPVCLVTGASGAIGPAVVEALAESHDVRTLTRRMPEPCTFSVPVTSLTGDTADIAAVARAARGASAIVHLAALLHIVNPPASMRAEYERVNIGGTAAVIDAAKSERVSRVVVLSTIAVYGYQQPGVRLYEESETHPDTFYGQTKLAAEGIALAARRADGGPLTTVLRSAAVYGPRVKGNYQRLVRALARHRFVPIGPGDNLRTLVFVDDLASAVAMAVRHSAGAGRVYNVSDGTRHTMRQIITAICDALGRRPPRWHAPTGPVRLMLRAASIVNPQLPRLLDKYLESVDVDATRIQGELGFRPATPLTAGWAATVADMRRSGQL